MPSSFEPMDVCAKALTANGCEVFLAEDTSAAKRIFFTDILPNMQARSVSWGDSLTMEATGVLADLLADASLEVIKTFEQGVPKTTIVERRRQALLTDLFLTGSNAVTKCGRIINLDMIGNRTAAISFGPKKVVLFVGRNKIVADLDSALDRVKNLAAPLNAQRHSLATPCAATGRCHDCSSPQRICNTWSILDKCFPKQRIKVILINEELGL